MENCKNCGAPLPFKNVTFGDAVRITIEECEFCRTHNKRPVEPLPDPLPDKRTVFLTKDYVMKEGEILENTHFVIDRNVNIIVADGCVLRNNYFTFSQSQKVAFIDTEPVSAPAER